MIILRWALFPEAEDVQTFKVYRSFIGFCAPIVDIAGKILKLKINGGPIQSFVFGTDSIVDTINSTIAGGQAYNSNDVNTFVVRSDIREAPGSIEILASDGAQALGLIPRLITEKSEDRLLSSVPVPEDTSSSIECVDPDGSISDYYAISTVNSIGDESRKTNYVKPINSTGPLCVIEGIVIGPQGERLPDAEISAHIQIPPEESGDSAMISKKAVKTISGPDGRYSLPLLQNKMYRIDIPITGYNKVVRVPEKGYVFINTQLVDLEYLF